MLVYEQACIQASYGGSQDVYLHLGCVVRVRSGVASACMRASLVAYNRGVCAHVCMCCQTVICLARVQEREAEKQRAEDKIKAKEAARNALEGQLQEKQAAFRDEQVPDLSLLSIG